MSKMGVLARDGAEPLGTLREPEPESFGDGTEVATTVATVPHVSGSLALGALADGAHLAGTTRLPDDLDGETPCTALALGSVAHGCAAVSRTSPALHFVRVVHWNCGTFLLLMGCTIGTDPFRTESRSRWHSPCTIANLIPLPQPKNNSQFHPEHN